MRRPSPSAPRESRWFIAGVAVAALAGIWLVDTAIDAFVLQRTVFLDELLHPSRSETWMRLLVAALVVLSVVLRRERSRALAYARQLEEATRLQDLFADILRHDLLGPATALRIGIDSLARREPSPAVARALGQLRRSCARLTEMIEAAARYAKISSAEELDLHPLDLRGILQEVVADFEAVAGERGARVELAVAPGPPELPILANPAVAEVFANLLSNALKYGPDGGVVSVAAEDAGARWVVAVADRGPGIPDEDKRRIFTRFERLEREGVKGTGLGLAIALRIVELHGGEIWVEDRAGGGCVFRVALPKRARSASGAPAAANRGG